MEIEINLPFEVSHNAKQPERGHASDAGLDLFVNSYELIDYSESCKRYDIDTGLRVAIPDGYVGLIFPRSSVSKMGVLTHTGVIDAGYTGIIRVILTSFSNKFAPFIGQKIAQLVIMPIAKTNLIETSVRDMTTDRGANGFGSTGA